VDARSRMMSATGVEGLSFGSEFFLFFLGFIPEAFPLVANPEGSQISKGAHTVVSSLTEKPYLRPPVLFTQVTATPSDSDGSPIMSSLSLIVSDVGHQGSFEGRFDYLLRRKRTPEPWARSSTISTSPTSGIQRVKIRNREGGMAFACFDS